MIEKDPDIESKCIKDQRPLIVSSSQYHYLTRAGKTRLDLLQPRD